MPTLHGKILDLLLPFERLDDASQQALEVVFRHFFTNCGKPEVALPSIWLWGGWAGWWMTRVAQAEGITFGRHVFLEPAAVARLLEHPPGARLDALLVHEATHVRQYVEAGTARFLWRYLRDYAGLLWKQRSLSAQARQAAYWNIPYEVEARAVESFFQRLGQKL
ncbi:MAG: DUF4157 domain-containing protein [Blastocatellia bacterium]|nr:DUF4157 domain-containing protein [Blastocatellia bacterium]